MRLFPESQNNADVEVEGMEIFLMTLFIKQDNKRKVLHYLLLGVKDISYLFRNRTVGLGNIFAKNIRV